MWFSFRFTHDQIASESATRYVSPIESKRDLKSAKQLSPVRYIGSGRLFRWPSCFTFIRRRGESRPRRAIRTLRTAIDHQRLVMQVQRPPSAAPLSAVNKCGWKPWIDCCGWRRQHKVDAHLIHGRRRGKKAESISRNHRFRPRCVSVILRSEYWYVAFRFISCVNALKVNVGCVQEEGQDNIWPMADDWCRRWR